MGILKRTADILSAKISGLLDRAEDPKEMLDYSYEKQKELLQKVTKGIANVMTAKKQLEIKRDELNAAVEKYQRQAEAAVNAGRDDLATLALSRKQDALRSIENLNRQIAGLDKNLENLKATKQKLEVKIQQFGAQKEILKAQYDASKATVQVKESLTGLSEDAADIKSTVDRIEERIQKQKARADALTTMVDDGTLDEIDFGSEKRDDIDRELAKIESKSRVNNELMALKAKLGKQKQ